MRMSHTIRSALAGLAAAALFTGCGLTPTGDAFRAGAIDIVQRAADGGVRNARDYLCEAATIGSLKRTFTSADLVASYNEFCAGTAPQIAILAERQAPDPAPDAPPAPGPDPPPAAPVLPPGW